MLDLEKICNKKNNYQTEIDCIRAIQVSQKTLIKSLKCRKGNIEVEPINFINANFGCCFDRARFIEKTLTYYGFKNRRVSLFATDKYGLFSLIIPNKDSHAATEAKTSRGWIGIESIEPYFVITDKNNNPLTFKQGLNLGFKFPEKTYNNFYYRGLISISGLYSRHGRFHKPNFPFPDINFKDFSHNLMI